ncbi:MAG: aspartate/glutamate racemase family protein [Roseomonas sp.]|nr:aspartate/glutamate racemase family protein [Roseomonas sp.]
MSVAYARNGLLGVLTPQANTTVEPEFSLLLPPATAMLTARLVSTRPNLDERLRDYVAGLDATCAQFANAPLGAIAFACTGSSYLVGPAAEDEAVARLSTHAPFITAGRAVCDAFAALGAKRIGLVSPYPPDLTEASAAYWTTRGFDVARVVAIATPGGAFHPIYALAEGDASAALAAMRGARAEAIILLGTGMPSLGAILAQPVLEGVPVISCNLALMWRAMAALRNEAADGASLKRWISGADWRVRYQERLGI